jgi:hypothetical protein
MMKKRFVGVARRGLFKMHGIYLLIVLARGIDSRIFFVILGNLTLAPLFKTLWFAAVCNPFPHHFAGSSELHATVWEFYNLFGCPNASANEQCPFVFWVILFFTPATGFADDSLGHSVWHERIDTQDVGKRVF